ncbi:MAG: MFS transporter [Anaerolineales bacterium]|nr:MFS transporter [Anaerolineales bacterium]
MSSDQLPDPVPSVVAEAAERQALPQDSSSTPQRIRRSFSLTFISLRHPNYRLWFGGQLVSLFGTWMQTTAQGFLVYELTRSPAYLGYVGFAAGVPVWLFTLYAGVIADRVSRRNLMILTQTAMMVLAFTLGALTFSGAVQPWHIIVMAFLLGTANAFDAPARQSFTIEMVGREDLTNAIALNATMFNAATVVGPAVSGIVYALAGAAWCFMINGATFLAVIAALLLMKLPRKPPSPNQESAMSGMRQGLGYVARTVSVRRLIAIVGGFSLIGIGTVTLMPAWSVEVLGGTAATNGLLLSARGVGAVVAGLMIASLGRYRLKGKLLTIGGFAMGALLLAFSAARSLPISLVTLAGVGWGFMMIVNTVNALVQAEVPDALRGRVMGVYTLVFFGVIPVGSLLIGIAATYLGEPIAVALSAALVLVFAAFLWLRWPALRRMP